VRHPASLAIIMALGWRIAATTTSPDRNCQRRHEVDRRAAPDEIRDRARQQRADGESSRAPAVSARAAGR
jgi:hypothetical protein